MVDIKSIKTMYENTNNFNPISYVELMKLIETNKMQEIYRQYGVGSSR